MAKTKKQDADLLSYSPPSDPKQRKEIRDIFYEMSGIQQMIKDRKDDLKGYVDTLTEKYNMPKKLIPKIAKIIEKHNFEEVAEEHSAIESTYEAIMANTTPAQSGEDDED
jgi:hypothetical protein